MGWFCWIYSWLQGGGGSEFTTVFEAGPDAESTSVFVFEAGLGAESSSVVGVGRGK